MMKQIRDLMTSDVVWVNPSTRVKTAVILMKGHNISALPVIHNTDGVVGLVTLHALLGEAQDAPISSLMDTNFASVDPDTTAHNAADLMQESNTGHLLVMENGRLLGIVSDSDLIPELGRTYDPLTELPWSDTFREWAMNALKKGQEISVILFDLDQFGRFNKKHGHVIGDRVLQEVAGVFKTNTDPNLELTCRYGGDEFAIVSVRLADEAEMLAARLQEKIALLAVKGLPEKVTATWGMFGGMRTKEREDMHYAATLDDLITRASKNCIMKKKPFETAKAQDAPAAPPRDEPQAAAISQPSRQEARASRASQDAAASYGDERAPRLKIDTISFSSTGTEVSACVILKRDGKQYKREVTGYTVGGNGMLRLFAEAAAGAVCKTLAPEHGIVVEDTGINDLGDDEELVTVVAIYISPRQNTRLAGTALVRRGDQYRAAVAALLDAVNRQIELAPPACDEEE
ncbi:MAG: GGDEF domain-containing protein [Armatimonadetes bacterium]|nr:GGDEF domain-containing protein [Armatimonadota bacterium]